MSTTFGSQNVAICNDNAILCMTSHCTHTHKHVITTDDDDDDDDVTATIKQHANIKYLDT